MNANIYPRHLRQAFKDGARRAAESTGEDAAMTSWEACESWNYNPKDVYGQAWMDGWRTAKAEREQADEEACERERAAEEAADHAYDAAREDRFFGRR